MDCSVATGGVENPLFLGRLFCNLLMVAARLLSLADEEAEANELVLIPVKDDTHLSFKEAADAGEVVVVATLSVLARMSGSGFRADESHLRSLKGNGWLGSKNVFP